MQEIPNVKRCPDCGAMPGRYHKENCDVQRCPECGYQMLSCGCELTKDAKLMPWTGEWPMVSEAVEYGWYAKFIKSKGWVICDKNDPGAQPNLNRVVEECRWDKIKQRWIKK